MRVFLLAVCSFLFAQNQSAQEPLNLQVKKYLETNSGILVSEFNSFLSLSNLAADREGLKANASFIMEMMRRRGIRQIQLLSPNDTINPPAIYGEWLSPGATKTLVFYAHYDGQPVNPSQWAKELVPFQPKLFTAPIDKGGQSIPFPKDGKYQDDWRIYARSAADDKAGIFAILNAVDAINKSGMKPAYNIKFFFEGEEEAGSPYLHEILEKYKSLLKADCWIICDGPVHQSGKKQIVFGVRGDTHLDLTVFASKRPLHSGHYGNWAPNPAMMLVELLASMKDENGRVTIKGFYDDIIPLTVSEKKALAEVPSVDEQMKKELGIKAGEMKGNNLTASINLPSLNINGIQSGNVGKLASNQIPTYATAVLDLRLVLGNDAKRQQQKVIDHIRSKGYYVIDRDPTDEERGLHEKIIKVIPGIDGYNAQRTSMELPVVKKIIAAVQTTTDEKLVLQPTMGGSLPLFLFEKHLQSPTITIPIANHDNNQHAENENIRMRNLFDGVLTMAALMLIK